MQTRNPDRFGQSSKALVSSLKNKDSKASCLLFGHGWDGGITRYTRTSPGHVRSGCSLEDTMTVKSPVRGVREVMEELKQHDVNAVVSEKKFRDNSRFLHRFQILNHLTI